MLAAAIEAEGGGSRRTRPGAVPDAVLTIGGRRLLYDVKCVRLCPSRYWPTRAVASARGGMLEHRARAVVDDYRRGAEGLDARVADHFRVAGIPPPVGLPSAVDILASFPPVRGLVFGSAACGGSREVGVLIEQMATSAAQREWRSIGARSLTEARGYLMCSIRRQVSFTAAVAHARLRLTRLELIGHSGRSAGRYASAAAVALVSPTAFEMARGGPMGGGGGRAGGMGGGRFE